MSFDSLDTDRQHLRDLFSGPAFGDQTQHLPLSRTQGSEEISLRSAFANTEQSFSGGLRRDVNLAANHCLNGLLELGAGRALRKKTSRAFTQRANRILACFVNGQDYYPDLWMIGGNFVEDVEATTIRHRDVEQHQIGLKFVNKV